MILWFAVAWAADTPDWHLAQARQFQKRGWLADADTETRAGLALDPAHVELNTICVELALPVGDVDRALRCAQSGAAADVGDLDRRAQLAQVEAWLRANFGWVELRGPEGVPRVRPALTSTGLQLDTALQQFTADTTARLHAGVVLPARVALPAGDYTLLGHALHVEPGQTSVLTLPPTDFAAAAGRGRRLDVAIGAIAFSGYDLENQRPGAQVDLRFSAPAGPVRLAVGASWEARAYANAADQDTFAPNTAGGTAFLVVPLELGGALLLAPAVGLRAAMAPGLRLACDDSTAPFVCRPDRAGETELGVYANGAALTPTGEVSVELNLGRVVLGLRGAVGHVFAVLPSPGQVQTAAGLLPFQSEPGVLEGGAYGVAASVGIGL